MQAGRLELVSNCEVPRAARKIRATFCPKVHITEPEYIVMGGEDTSVYIYDISKPSQGPLVVNQLQVSAGLVSAHAVGLSTPPYRGLPVCKMRHSQGADKLGLAFCIAPVIYTVRQLHQYFLWVFQAIVDSIELPNSEKLKMCCKLTHIDHCAGSHGSSGGCLMELQ